MKKNVIFLFICLFSTVCFANITDSTSFKKHYHTIELSLGISSKAKNKNVASSKGHVMYGFWYDYSLKAKNNIYLSFILNPQFGGDQFYNETYTNNGFSSEKFKTSYFLFNAGVGIKYKINLSKSEPEKHCLIFSLGDLFSYKHLYAQSSTNVLILNNPSINSTTYYNEKYNLKNQPIRFNSFSTAFPLFAKLSYCKKRLICSLTQYLFTHESNQGNGFYERFYTNINIGITL